MVGHVCVRMYACVYHLLPSAISWTPVNIVNPRKKMINTIMANDKFRKTPLSYQYRTNESMIGYVHRNFILIYTIKQCDMYI